MNPKYPWTQPNYVPVQGEQVATALIAPQRLVVWSRFIGKIFVVFIILAQKTS
jgi:hypothetical protein